MKKVTVACVQYAATPDWQRDLLTARNLLREAVDRGAKLVALPELCIGLDAQDGRFKPAAFREAEHPAIPAFSQFAQENAVSILLGSIGVLSDDGRVFNRSFLFDSSGKIVARYDKIHMFDIDLGSDGLFRESDTVAPGDRAVLAPCLGTTLGMSICYDLRFPSLYRGYARAGAKLLAVPAAFTRITGQAHWHVLLRARAIESGAFVLAPGQCGKLECGAECYGHSLIIDPWGEVLADAGANPGVITAEIDLDQVQQVRHKIPAWQVDRSFVMQTNAELP